MERGGNDFANIFGNLPEIVENVIWHLDARSVLRAKEVCRLWKETIEHLERYNRLWRHLCLQDIHRASLIDIVGFNPLSDDCQEDLPCGDDGEFEDLWKNVYRSWRAGQFLNHCKKSSFKLTGFSNGPSILLIGAYVYMIAHTVCNTRLSVWNIDTSEQVLYSQDLRCDVNRTYSCSKMFAHLQNPLCKFSQHQDLTQHSLIILGVGNIQWWIFINGEFHLANMLPDDDHGIMGVWHNTLVTYSYKRIMKVFILERRQNECNFCARNVSEELPSNLNVTSMNVWNNKCLFSVKSEPYSIAIYGLDNFQQQLIVTGLANVSYFGTLRLFGDFILNSIGEVNHFSTQRNKLYVFNTKTGEQLHVKVNGVSHSRYKLHGDLLIVSQNLLDKVSLCRINKTRCKDPVWCEYDSQQSSIEDEEDIGDNIRDDDGYRMVIPEVFETKKMIHRLKTFIISYGESIVILKGITPSHECFLDQYVY
ncbi:uncharacterized protein LOC117101510 [Anneissia japonica]|uniref:uncharacterized protein LOC117101510 n=1 Tax=Anneissia japonica TaxID=1529436 RepID=UPI0014256F5E|nr:uncharacterized protein LOC117101510 [Anneissia japonica]